jgi:hypothetical protein
MLGAYFSARHVLFVVLYEWSWHGVNGSENLFKGHFSSSLGYGKSPCFLQIAFLRLLSPDYLVLSLLFVDGQENME